MGLRIQTNIPAETARRSLRITSERQSKTYQRLASGNRITSAGDDAAGLSISENLRAQIRSLTQAERNANDGISLVQVAEGGLTEVANMIIRLRELSIQAATDTVGDRERGFIHQEFQSLVQEVDRIANVTTFNGTPLLNGESPKSPLELQVGIRNDQADRIEFPVGQYDIRSSSLGIEGLSSETVEAARESIDSLDGALGSVNEARARLGAMQNKLTATTNNILIARENLNQARSRISDADMAEETSHLIRENILQSAGIAVLTQANQAPLQALKLL